MQYTILILSAIATGLIADLWFFSLGDPHLGEVKRGRILSWLGLWLEGRYMKKHDRLEKKLAQKTMPPKGVKPRPNWDRPNNWKILLCPTCFNVWWSTLVFVVELYVLEFSWTWLWGWLFWCGFSNLALYIIQAKRAKH